MNATQPGTKPLPALAGLAESSPEHPGTPDGALILHTTRLGDLVVPDGAAREDELRALAARAATYAACAHGDGTRRVYRSAWRGYEAWCRALGREPLAGDPELLARYANRRVDEGVAVSTLRTDLAAIRTAHLLASIPLDLRDPRLIMLSGRVPAGGVERC